MSNLTSEQPPTIERTDNSLTIGGTRITLYDVMDYVTMDWPPRLIRDRLNLTDQQIAVALEYITTHRAEVEAEYQQVLEIALENRRYWETYNRERLMRIAATHPPLTKEALQAKLQARNSPAEASR